MYTHAYTEHAPEVELARKLLLTSEMLAGDVQVMAKRLYLFDVCFLLAL
jgi:hypothetical protein